MRKPLSMLSVIILLVLLIILVGGWLYLRTSLPRTIGAVQVDGISEQVEIVRDQEGVPHIFAATDYDAMFGLGYVHAQDRMWQMEFNRRLSAGRLSEILGPSTLEMDKFLRTLGIYRAAESALPTLNPDARLILKGYAAGVNAWLAERHTLPLEFLILDVEPQPWSVVDSLAWSKMLAWDMSDDYDEELLRVRLVQALGPERTAELLPQYATGDIDDLAAKQMAPSTADSLLQMDSVLQRTFQLNGPDAGSNNWVVAGSLTEKGLPMLANDPHLGASIPSIWYLAEIQGDRIHVTGATLPALPAVVMGHNQQISWGVTNAKADVQDLYMERINRQDPNQYEVDGEWVDMEIVEELIWIDGEEEPLHWAARSTRHGPLISDVTDTATPVALRWTALDPGDTTFNAFTGINYARSWREFLDANRQLVVPSLSFVYADVNGHIGFVVPGRLPIRARGQGRFPVPGWDSSHEWTSWIPFDELPQIADPETGFIVTANNRIVDDDYPYHISNTWVAPYRAERITSLLMEFSANDRKLTLDDFRRIQGDQTSSQAHALLPYLLELEPQSDRQQAALETLRSWDGSADRESGAAAIYEAWFIQLGWAMYEDDLRGDLYEMMAERNHPLFLLEVLSAETGDSPWCDDVLTAPLETCAQTASIALDRALDDLENRLGKNPDRWRWGDLLRTTYPHRPFSEVSLLQPFFERSIANGGDRYTVNVSPIRLDRLYDQTHGPSYRHLIDLSDFNLGLFVQTTGQSGNVLSRHYDNFVERHRDVEYVPMTFGRDRVQGKGLLLEP